MGLLTIPFRVIAAFLGVHMEETPFQDDKPETREIILKIGQAISRADRFTPWETKCLVQAMAGKAMMRRRALESTLYLGLLKKPDLEHLEAHAWLRYGSKIVCGGKNISHYTVVSTFGRKAKKKNN